MAEYEVLFYQKENGESPALEFYYGLSNKMRARVQMIIRLLEDIGPQIRMPYSEPLRNGIFQIRAQQEGNITRILYFFTDGKKIILTNGFVKKDRQDTR